MNTHQAFPRQYAPRSAFGPYFHNRKYEGSPAGQAMFALALVSSSAIGVALFAVLA